MEITERKVGDLCIVGITGMLDSVTAGAFAQRLHQRIDGGGTAVHLE